MEDFGVLGFSNHGGRDTLVWGNEVNAVLHWMVRVWCVLLSIGRIGGEVLGHRLLLLLFFTGSSYDAIVLEDMYCSITALSQS
jgi:hypothetical protein